MAINITQKQGEPFIIVNYYPPSGRRRQGGHLPQTSARSKQYLPVIFVCLAFIRQNFRESWCRKLLAISGHKNPFHESKNEGASEL